ncbi:MAG TPA: prevent-host-death family protein [Oceanospirillaceae bacterium]|nr:prevent-host-death family protein [Oceanospirillaceae bacterium]
MQATTKDLRLHTNQLLAATDRGEKITITYHGKPRAQLSPIIARQDKPSSTNPVFGMWQDKQETSVDQTVRSMRQGRSFS